MCVMNGSININSFKLRQRLRDHRCNITFADGREHRPAGNATSPRVLPDEHFQKIDRDPAAEQTKKVHQHECT